LDAFLDALLTWSFEHAKNDLQRNSAWHMISSIVNKRAEGQGRKCPAANTNSYLTDVTTFLSDKLDHFWAENVINRNHPLARRQQAIQSWIWASLAFLVPFL